MSVQHADVAEGKASHYVATRPDGEAAINLGRRQMFPLTTGKSALRVFKISWQSRASSCVCVCIWIYGRKRRCVWDVCMKFNHG